MTRLLKWNTIYDTESIIEYGFKYDFNDGMRFHYTMLRVRGHSQRLLHHGAVLVVLIGDFVLSVRHAGELVGLVVAHFQGVFYTICAGQHLFGHVSCLVIGIAFAIARALQEARHFAQRVVSVAAGGCFTVLGARFTRDIAVLVVAILERNTACAAGGLLQQTANAVIAVCRCQGA